MASITSANTIIMMSVVGVFNSPVQMQQFAADDIFGNDSIPGSEIAMGVDGHMTAGFVFAPIPWSIHLMGDATPSTDLFDGWYLANRKAIDVFYANATVLMPSLSKKYTLTRGSLTSYKVMPDAGKTLRTRTYTVTWQSIAPANL
jgi:hypothetical protein